MTRRFGLKRVDWNPLEDVSRIQSFNNEVWLEVQGKFIQDYQDIDSNTGEGLSLDQKTSAKCLKESKKRLK